MTVIFNPEHLNRLEKSRIMPVKKFCFESSGRIIYDPNRPGMKKRTQWWAIVQTCPGITEYYRSFLNKQLHMHNVVMPAWGSHISIIRGEKPKPEQMNLWGKFRAGEKINFMYTHEVYSDGNYWWLNVYAPELFEIRDAFRLPTNYGFHLTIGKDKYKDLI